VLTLLIIQRIASLYQRPAMDEEIAPLLHPGAASAHARATLVGVVRNATKNGSVDFGTLPMPHGRPKDADPWVVSKIHQFGSAACCVRAII